MCVDKQKHLLDGIEDLLEKQIELAQHGNISDVEALSEQAGPLVEKIVQTGILGLPEFKNRREQIHKLYKNLCLAITDQKADVSEKLSLVRKGKKTIEAYRNNI